VSFAQITCCISELIQSHTQIRRVSIAVLCPLFFFRDFPAAVAASFSRCKASEQAAGTPRIGDRFVCKQIGTTWRPTPPVILSLPNASYASPDILRLRNRSNNMNVSNEHTLHTKAKGLSSCHFHLVPGFFPRLIFEFRKQQVNLICNYNTQKIFLNKCLDHNCCVAHKIWHTYIVYYNG